MSNVNNPGQLGSYKYSNIVYAAPGLDYSSSPDLNEYNLYHSPTDGFTTRRFDDFVAKNEARDRVRNSPS